MLAAVAVSAWWRASWPVALCGGGSFLALIGVSRGLFTPSGRFGYANAVTALRLALVLFLGISQAWLGADAAALVASSVLLLDALDGAVARRRGDASAFGAHFDMETDALFVLVLTLRLWLVAGFGAWVLTAGLLRYAYVLSLWFAPGTGREAPRSLLGRYAFLILALNLIAGLAAPHSAAVACVALGTFVVSGSFARSFYFSHAAH